MLVENQQIEWLGQALQQGQRDVMEITGAKKRHCVSGEWQRIPQPVPKATKCAKRAGQADLGSPFRSGDMNLSLRQVRQPRKAVIQLKNL